MNHFIFSLIFVFILDALFLCNFYLFIYFNVFFFCRKAQEQDKKVVVAGCVPQAQPRMDYLKSLSIIGVISIFLQFLLPLLTS